MYDQHPAPSPHLLHPALPVVLPTTRLASKVLHQRKVRVRVVLQGTNASHLAQCLGLDASRYGHSGSTNNSLAAVLREEALQV
jgi:hypothetical protein